MAAAEVRALREQLVEAIELHAELLAEHAEEDDEDALAELQIELDELEPEIAEHRSKLGLPDLTPAELAEIREEMDESVKLIDELKAEMQTEDEDERAEMEEEVADLGKEVAEARLKLGLDFVP